MSILEDFYTDCSSFCDKLGYNNSAEYKQIVKKLEKKEETLYSHFTEELKALYEEVRLLQLEKENIEDLRVFKKAVSYGALLMLEILQEEF